VGDLIQFPGGQVDVDFIDSFEWTDELLREYAAQARTLAARYRASGPLTQIPRWPRGVCQSCRRVPPGRLACRYRVGCVLNCAKCAEIRLRVRKGFGGGGVSVSECDFQAAVIEAAQLLRWRVAHFRAARIAQGWRTPVQADGAGFPDLIAVRGTRLIAAELKSERGKLRPEQANWLEALQAAGAEARIWRPADRAAIEERLR
jgi:hypothetical protein